MRALRRVLQVVAIVGTLLVGIVALALIVSQTPWFRDWLRRYIVRESKQYLNGELTVGGIGGNLLFGVHLSDVTVDVSGERIISLKNVEVDYSVFELVSTGVVLNEIKLTQPAVRIERDRQGWNIGRLVREQRTEADREGPGRPISLKSIEIADGTIYFEDAVAGQNYRVPRRIDDLDVKAAFEYAPVHYSLDLQHVAFRGWTPEFALQELTGAIGVREDNLYLERMVVRTAESSLTLDGVVERYLSTPIVKVTTSGTISLPELGRVVPVAAGYPLRPAVNVKANGPANALALSLDLQSEAGNVRGDVTADVQAPDLGVRGDLDLQHLNLAPILKDPTQRSNITGHAKVDLRMASKPANVRAADRVTGTFAFSGPHVVAAGYEARNVRASGRLDGPRITIDGRGAAYGGTATARGFIVTRGERRPTSFDLRGRADGVDFRRLPASVGAPRVVTKLSASEYHVRRAGSTTSGSATLNQSEVEGATIADDTVVEFSIDPRNITYTARGSVTGLNLYRIGTAFGVAAMAKPDYESLINGRFDLTGSQPRPTAPARRGGEDSNVLATTTLDATGTMTDSALLGGRLPELAFEAHLENGALQGRADGRFEEFDPARLTARPNLKGRVTGTVNAAFSIADLTAPVTVEGVSADGSLTLESSTVGGLRIDRGNIEGKFVSQVADLVKAEIAGPDVKANASGRLALDRTSTSNLMYHIEASDLVSLGSLAGQEGLTGSAILDGSITGNAASLQTTGTLDGSSVGYGENKALDLNSRYSAAVPDLRFADAKVTATSDATFVALGSLQINSVTATTTYEQRKIDFKTNIKEKTRELDAQGQLVLHADHQEMHLPALAIRTQGIEWRMAPGADAAVRYGRGRVELENITLVSADQSLDLSGTLALGTEKPSGAIDVRASNVDLAQLETLLLQNRGFTGRLSATAKVTGTTAAPAVDGHVEVRNGAFRTYKYESLIADVDYTGTRMAIDATLRQSPTEALTAKGTVPTSLFAATPGPGGHVPSEAGDAVDLRITTTAINLAVVQGLTDLVTNVTGTLDADVRVTGSGHDPHLEGHIDIKGGAFGVPLGGVSYSGLTTRIEFAQDTVRLQKFNIVDEHGEPLTVSGELAVHERQVGAVNVSLESQNFEVIDNELGDVGLDSQIKITGELRRPRIEGRVRVEAGRLEVDQILQLFYDPYSLEALPDVVSAERAVEGSGSAEDATRSALQRAQVTAAPPGAAARADVRVRKSPAGPITLLGTVQTVRGSYDFQGRRFELVRGGTLRFLGEPQLNPLIDITANRLIPGTGVEARVHLTGTVQAPELALSSNPPLDEADILSLIVFNRSVNELGTGERASLAATAGGIATGFIASPLGESIGKALDLDLFEITTTTDEGDLGAGLTVGQQIGDKAFVKLRQQFGDRNVTEFMIEYQLRDVLRLQVTAAPETTGSANRLNQRRVERAGIDLIFFFSY
ncbi:MAG: translocation/assembly module TamB domain-containing protein [Acidobacteria bacterium]|nr:translocation/assembly module TamB domain-containing protein [Acidobacteriota bacterium]